MNYKYKCEDCLYKNKQDICLNEESEYFDDFVVDEDFCECWRAKEHEQKQG